MLPWPLVRMRTSPVCTSQSLPLPLQEGIVRQRGAGRGANLISAWTHVGSH